MNAALATILQFANLPSTGLIFNQWIPITAGILLLLGALAITFTIVSRRKNRAAADNAASSGDETPEA